MLNYPLVSMHAVTEHTLCEELVSALPTGVIVLDTKGIIQLANPMAQELLDCALVGHAWRDILLAVFSPKDDDGHEISLKNGRRIRIATVSLPAHPGQLLTLTDLTESRELLEKVGQQRRLVMMGTMMASLAHQLRTPLTTALLYVGHLLQPTLAEIQRREFTQKIFERLHFMEQTIRNCLVFAKSGHTEIAEIFLPEFLTEVHQLMSPSLLTKNIQLQLNNQIGDLRFLGNRDALLNALQNLIENAQQASDANSVIECLAQSVDGDYFDLIIRDHGLGIAEELQAEILKPFYTTRGQGTGLGLSVAVAIAKAHRGELWLESELRQGTSVGLRLPRMNDA